MAFPKLNEIFEEYKDRKVNIISINPLNNSTKDSIMTNLTISRNKLNFQIGFCANSLTKNLKLQSYPTLYILDKNKKILYSHIGYNETDYKINIKTILDKYLN